MTKVAQGRDDQKWPSEGTTTLLTYVKGMSPENLKKIAHSGPEISLYLSNFSKEVSQLTD